MKILRILVALAFLIVNTGPAYAQRGSTSHSGSGSSTSNSGGSPLWKGPVATHAELPVWDTPGSMRCVLDENAIYGFDQATNAWVLLTGSGGVPPAPSNAAFITQVPDAVLTNEQALSLLATGLLKSTTGTGVISTAIAQTDYQLPYWEESPAGYLSPIVKANNVLINSGGLYLTDVTNQRLWTDDTTKYAMQDYGTVPFPMYALDFIGAGYGTTYAAGGIFFKEITVPFSATGVDITDYPLLVSFTDLDIRTIANGGHVANASGYDLIFTDPTGVTMYDFEIERYNPVTGEVIAWVRVPTLSSSTDTVVRMYFGNPAIVTPQENPPGVYDAGYEIVWHCDELSGTTIDDSTNTYNGTLLLGGATLGATSPIGYGIETFKTDVLQSTLNLDMTGTGPGVTYDLWILPATGGGGDDDLIGYKYGPYGWGVERNGTQWGVYSDFVGTSTDSGTATMDAWQHLVITYDPSTLLYTCYVDGNPTFSGSIAVGVGPNFVLAGGDSPGPATPSWWGRFDEVKISSTVRTGNYINVEYRNMSSPNTFYAVGPLMGGSPPAALNPANFIGLTAWVRTTDTGMLVAALADAVDVANQSYALAIGAVGTGLVNAIVGDGVGGLTFRSSNIAVNDGNWHLISMVYDSAGPSLDVYIDGVLDNGSLTGTIPASLSAVSVPFIHGAALASGVPVLSFIGDIDDLRAYSALNAGDIATLFSDPPNTTAGTLISRWTYDEGTASSAADSISGFTAHLSGSGYWTPGYVSAGGTTGFYDIISKDLTTGTVRQSSITTSGVAHILDTDPVMTSGKLQSFRNAGTEVGYISNRGQSNLHTNLEEATVFVKTGEPVVPGYRYTTVADAIAYLNTVGGWTVTYRPVIKLLDSTNSEDITLPDYFTLEGKQSGEIDSILTGNIILGEASILRDFTLGVASITGPPTVGSTYPGLVFRCATVPWTPANLDVPTGTYIEYVECILQGMTAIDIDGFFIMYGGGFVGNVQLNLAGILLTYNVAEGFTVNNLGGYWNNESEAYNPAASTTPLISDNVQDAIDELDALVQGENLWDRDTTWGVGLLQPHVDSLDSIRLNNQARFAYNRLIVDPTVEYSNPTFNDFFYLNGTYVGRTPVAELGRADSNTNYLDTNPILVLNQSDPTPSTSAGLGFQFFNGSTNSMYGLISVERIDADTASMHIGTALSSSLGVIVPSIDIVNGYVGIYGEPNPLAPLHVNGDIWMNGQLPAGGGDRFIRLPTTATVPATRLNIWGQGSTNPAIDAGDVDIRAGDNWSGGAGIPANLYLRPGGVSSSGYGEVRIATQPGADAPAGRVGLLGNADTFEVEVAGNVGPHTPDTYDFGNVANRWDGYYGRTIDLWHAAAGVTSADQTFQLQHLYTYDTTGGAIADYAARIVSSMQRTAGVNPLINYGLAVTAQNADDNMAGLFQTTSMQAILARQGTTANYAARFSDGTRTVVVADGTNALTVTGDILPTATTTYSFGHPNWRWQDGYFNDGTCGVNITAGGIALAGSDSASNLVQLADGTWAIDAVGPSKLGGDVTIGLGTAGVDYVLTFDGGSSDGSITFDEGNNWFVLSDVARYLSHPTFANDTELVDKLYVDNLVGSNLVWKQPVINFWDASLALPVGPALGDRYICSVAGSGWTLNHIYQCVTAGSWVGATDYTPAEGWAAYIKTTDQAYWYDGATWILFASIFQHNTLAGIQGGSAAGAGDRWHMNLSEWTELTNWLDNVVLSTNGDTQIRMLTIGSGELATDYTITFDGATNDGLITWREALDRFDMTCDLYVDETIGVGIAPQVDNKISTNWVAAASTASLDGIETTVSGTYDTTATQLASVGHRVAVSSTRSAGANSLNNLGIFATASGGQTNIAIEGIVSGAGTNVAGVFGDGVRTAYLADGLRAGYFTDGTRTVNLSDTNQAINAVSGSRTVHVNDASYNLYSANGTVDTLYQGGANTNLYLQSVVAGATASRVSNRVTSGGSYDTTAGALTNRAFQIFNNGSRSAGANTLTNYGIDVSVIGGQTNIAGYFTDGVRAVYLANSADAITTVGNIIPFADNAYDLGIQTTNRWQDVWAVNLHGNIDTALTNEQVAYADATGVITGDNDLLWQYGIDRFVINSTTNDNEQLWVKKALVATQQHQLAAEIQTGGTTDTTVGNRYSRGLKVDVTTTESAGANVLTNIGIESNVSGGDAHIAGRFTDGVGTVDVATDTYALYASGLASRFVNGARVATLASGVYAGYFTDGTRTVELTNGANALVTAGTNILGGNTTIGLGAAGVDYTLTFDGQDNDGVITWQEDEDNFQMTCGLHVGDMFTYPGWLSPENIRLWVGTDLEDDGLASMISAVATFTGPYHTSAAQDVYIETATTDTGDYTDSYFYGSSVAASHRGGGNILGVYGMYVDGRVATEAVGNVVIGDSVVGMLATGSAVNINAASTITIPYLSAMEAMTIVNNNIGAGITITDVYGFRVLQDIIDAGTITNVYGVNIAETNALFAGSVTNLYGLYIGDQTPMGATNTYNFYSAGAAAINVFEGYLSGGSATEGWKLETAVYEAENYPMLAGYSGSTYPDIGMIKNGMIIREETSSLGAPSLILYDADADEAGWMWYDEANDQFSMLNKLHNIGGYASASWASGATFEGLILDHGPIIGPNIDGDVVRLEMTGKIDTGIGSTRVPIGRIDSVMVDVDQPTDESTMAFYVEYNSNLINVMTLTRNGIQGNFIAPGNDTEMLYNDGGVINGADYATYNDATGTLSTRAIEPLTNNTYDLGATGLRWNDLWAQGYLIVGTSVNSGYIGYDTANSAITIDKSLAVNAVLSVGQVVNPVHKAQAVWTIANAGQGRMIWYGALSGSNDTASGNATNYASYNSISTTRNGVNTLTNKGVYATASGADINTAIEGVTITGAGTNIAGRFTDGTRVAELADETQAAHFTWGAKYVNVLSSTAGLYSDNGDLKIWLDGSGFYGLFVQDAVKGLQAVIGDRSAARPVGANISASGATYTYQAMLADGMSELAAWFNDNQGHQVTIGDGTYAINAIGKIALKETGVTPTYFTTFQAGDQAATLDYTLPTAYPTINGQAITSTTAGVMSWSSGAVASSYVDDFTNVDLVAGILTVTHNLGSKYCVVAVYNNNDKIIIPDDVTGTDANTTTIDLSSFGTITGTWNVRIVK